VLYWHVTLLHSRDGAVNANTTDNTYLPSLSDRLLTHQTAD